jgi:hypothetical protein
MLKITHVTKAHRRDQSSRPYASLLPCSPEC